MLVQADLKLRSTLSEGIAHPAGQRRVLRVQMGLRAQGQDGGGGATEGALDRPNLHEDLETANQTYEWGKAREMEW